VAAWPVARFPLIPHVYQLNHHPLSRPTHHACLPRWASISTKSHDLQHTTPIVRTASLPRMRISSDILKNMPHGIPSFHHPQAAVANSFHPMVRRTTVPIGDRGLIVSVVTWVLLVAMVCSLLVRLGLKFAVCGRNKNRGTHVRRVGLDDVFIVLAAVRKNPHFFRIFINLLNNFIWRFWNSEFLGGGKGGIGANFC